MKTRPRSRHLSRHSRAPLVLLSIAFAAAAPSAALGQDDETPQNLIGWLKYKGTHPVGKREAWALRADAEIKRNQLVVDPVSVKFRLGFELQSRVRLAAGYYFAWHSPYDAASQPYSFPEQGAWEEVTFSHDLGSSEENELDHRLRMEQQWLARRDSAGAPIDRWKFENVLAYRAQFVLGEASRPSSRRRFGSGCRLARVRRSSIRTAPPPAYVFRLAVHRNGSSTSRTCTRPYSARCAQLPAASVSTTTFA